MTSKSGTFTKNTLGVDISRQFAILILKGFTHMGGRPAHFDKITRFQKLRKQKKTYRWIRDYDRVLKGTDLKTMVRWSKYDVGKMWKKALDV